MMKSKKTGWVIPIILLAVLLGGLVWIIFAVRSTIPGGPDVPNPAAGQETAPSAPDMASLFGYDTVWTLRDRVDESSILTELYFREDGTFACCAGFELSELIAAFFGVWQLSDGELTLDFTLSGTPMSVTYRVDWEHRTLTQCAGAGLVVAHEIGDVLTPEVSRWMTPEDVIRHAEAPGTFEEY